MEPEAIIVHRMPGRIRIRVPSKRGNIAYFATAKESLSSFRGVEGVEVAPFTGSILLRCKGPVDDVTGWARSQGLFAIKEEQRIRVTSFHDSVADRFAALDERIKTVTGQGFDLPGLAFLALMVAGIYQIARGNFAAPAWYTAFWYALGIFGKSSGKSGPKEETGPIG